MNYDNITILKGESFGFWIDNIDYGEEIIKLQCYDRQDNLINGLVHELTEATIMDLVKQITGEYYGLAKGMRVKNPKDYMDYNISICHLATVLSLPYYKEQFNMMYLYESMLKYRK